MGQSLVPARFGARQVPRRTCLAMFGSLDRFWTKREISMSHLTGMLYDVSKILQRHRG